MSGLDVCRLSGYVLEDFFGGELRVEVYDLGSERKWEEKKVILVRRDTNMGTTYYHVMDLYRSLRLVDRGMYKDLVKGEKINDVWTGYAIGEIIKKLNEAGVWWDMIYDNGIVVNGEYVIRLNGVLGDLVVEKVVGGCK